MPSSDVHVTVQGVVFHNPGQPPSTKGAGQTIVQQKDASGKVISTSGQVPGTSVVHTNPA
jgi:hypothetical protein